MSPKTEVMIDVAYGANVINENKTTFTIDEEAGERTPLLGKKKTTIKKSGVHLDPAVLALFTFLVVGTMIGMYLLCHDERPLNFQIPLRLIERTDMLSSPPHQFFPVHTLSELILADNQLPECKNKTQCLSVINGQNLPYNFLIGGDGNVYEVLGWDFLSGLSALQARDKAFVIGFSGKVDGLQLVKAFAAEAIHRKRLVSDYKMYGLTNDSMPGKDLTGASLFKQFIVLPQWSGVIETS